MDQTLGRLRTAWIQVKPLLSFSPVSGYLWLDTIMLLLVGTLHHTLLPSITHGVFAIDLMTPWLVTTLVCETLPRGLFLAGIGALILETHSATPAGFYLCTYWVIAVAIHLTRGTLSWRHAMPWAFTFGLSQLWVVFFATFVLAVNAGSSIFTWMYLRVQCETLLTGIALGMLFCHRYLGTGIKGEDG